MSWELDGPINQTINQKVMAIDYLLDQRNGEDKFLPVDVEDSMREIARFLIPYIMDHQFDDEFKKGDILKSTYLLTSGFALHIPFSQFEKNCFATTIMRKPDVYYDKGRQYLLIHQHNRIALTVRDKKGKEDNILYYLADILYPNT